MWVPRLAEILASLEEQNVQLEVRKVPDKTLMFEIRMPERINRTTPFTY